MIKKYGGETTHSSADADYAVLSKKSSVFKELRKEWFDLEKPAVSSLFIAECIKQKALIDPEEHEFDPPEVKGGRSAAKKATGDSEPKAKVERKSRERSTKHETPKPGRKKEPIKETSRESYTGHLRSPTPPNEPPVSGTRTGSHLFTEADREYCERYFYYLIVCSDTNDE